MTGHGRGNAATEGWRINVECGSVNRKGLEISVALPKTIASLELKVREAVQKSVQRGRVNINVTLEYSGQQTSGQNIVDMVAARLSLIHI